MEIKPVKQQYDLTVMNHSMKAEALHFQDKRIISYYFDDKMIHKTQLPAGDLISDDNCIREIVENYSKNNVGVYADIFKNHSDKVFLLSKIIEVDVVNYGIVAHAKVKVEKDLYFFELLTDNQENHMSGSFKASNFSEVLEKMRIVVSMMAGVSTKMTEDINELSSDKVEEVIKWQE